MHESPELALVVRRMYAAMSSGDAGWLAETVSADPTTVGIGSDPGEWFDGGAALRNAWTAQWRAGLDDIRLDPTRLRAYEEGEIGWAADEPVMVVGGEPSGTLRVTTVFRREGGAWRIVQLHTSVGVPNEEVVGREL